MKIMTPEDIASNIKSILEREDLSKPNGFIPIARKSKNPEVNNDNPIALLKLRLIGLKYR